MEAPKDVEYCYTNTFLHPPGVFPVGNAQSCGTLELELLGNRGRLCCRTGQIFSFLQNNQGFDLVVFLSKKSTGENFKLGRIDSDQDGRGVFTRSFSDLGLKVEKSPSQQTGYSIRIVAVKDLNGQKVSSVVLVEGAFKIPFEIRDERVVGFKKEAKVEKTAKQHNNEINPLFKKVEPFQPPLPATVWWQISIQPVYEYGYLQEDYCPRRKSNKAVF